MRRETILNAIGLSLLAVCFALSLGRVFTRTAREADENSVRIRFAHWQLEGGVRDAFDRLAREYEALHPGVEVEQMAIPEKIAKNWARTQLVGGTAPDLIQLGGTMGTTDEVLARYFRPLSDLVNLPNPYNAGTELADTAWRETFIDGLSGNPNYIESLLDYFGIPSSMFTVRMYYNRDLWREVLGAREEPETFEEFIDICRTAANFEAPGGGKIIAVAGSKYNAPFVLDALFSSQTQKLKKRLGPARNLAASGADLGLAYLEDEWNWDSPAVRSGLELMMRAGKFMQPGFLSLGRDDALFYFAQQQALMISTGSWDSSSLRIQVPFEIGVFRIPLPSPRDPRYGAYTQGQISEAGTQTGLSFGITSGSKHPAVALDFLQFITSKSANATFSRVSGWLPAVVGVSVPESIAPFEPDVAGYVSGFTPSLSIGADTERVVSNFLHRLVGPAGSVENFTSLLKSRFGPAIQSDLARMRKNNARNAAAKDVTISAFQVIGLKDGGASGAPARAHRLMEAQNQQEAELYYMNYKLQQLDLQD